MVASMMRKEATFGRMWRQMTRKGPTPMYLAAWTNSRSLRESVIERTTRAVIIQPKTASSPTKAIQPPPRSLGEMIAMIRKAGKTSSRSMPNISSRSVQPPK